MTLCAVLTWWGTVWYRQITDEEEAIAELRNIGVDVTLFVPNSKEAATITSGPPQWFRNLVGKKDFLHASEVEFGIEHTYIVEKQQPGDVPNIEYGPYHKNCNIAIDLS